MRVAALLLISAALASCAIGPGGGSVDPRFTGLPRVELVVDGFPVYFKAIEVQPGVWDVETGEARLVAVTGIAEPLPILERYRKAADQGMAQLAAGRRTRLVSELASLETSRLWRRYELDRAQ